MSDSDWREQIGPPVRILQIIIGGLLGGCVTLAVVAVVLGPLRPPAEAGAGGIAASPMTYSAIGLAVVLLIARIVVGQAVLSNARRKIAAGTWQAPPGRNSMMPDFLERTGDAGRLLMVLQTKTIIEGAILEGAAFFALIAHLIEGTWLSLILAAVLIGGIAMSFPTAARVRHWIEEQLQLVELQRQFPR